MTPPLHKQDLVCPDPSGCPVIRRVPDWQVTIGRLDADVWHRAYDGTWGYDEYNPGYGDARFSPFDSRTGSRVPSMYLASDETGALLETLFHSVDESTARDRLTCPVLNEKKFRDWLIVAMSSPVSATLADFRDPALATLRLSRSQLITSPAEHYPCTRRIAAAVHADVRNVDGIIWHSRQAEITGHELSEAVVLFGDRHPNGRGVWRREGVGVRNLSEGAGRELVEQIARAVGIEILPLGE